APLGGGRAAAAARCLGAAHALLPPGHVTTTAERAMRDHAEGAVVAVLGRAAFDAAYAEGGGLSLAEATALV
ncbi:hypothetical protein, partial [Streptomyces sp. NPDC003667]